MVGWRGQAAEERKRCGGSDLMSGLKAAQLHTDSARAVVVQHKHTLDVFAAHRPKRLLKVTNVHYKKLQELWRRHAAGRGKRTWEGKAGKGKGRAAAGKGDGDGEHAGSAEERQRFHNDLLCVLLRYHALQGHGFQAAAGEHVFRALLQHVGASMECFASPLNCHFAPFCSAFPDTDAPFGSLGDFFTFHPSRGSFQANPPFVPKVRSRPSAVSSRFKPPHLHTSTPGEPSPRHEPTHPMPVLCCLDDAADGGDGHAPGGAACGA
jgi:hypothetical protein